LDYYCTKEILLVEEEDYEKNDENPLEEEGIGLY